eukprot:TRINITY_DN4300_c0_g2_i1.p1 TRINITY_DN4300_c0_g2~~TRINITY_DN4300_c0_g2_i1.p1  ORF type:complete len:193 (+),score=56.25 TRINITY_DN4300_c0_g2_i1:72-650(+)
MQSGPHETAGSTNVAAHTGPYTVHRPHSLVHPTLWPKGQTAAPKHVESVARQETDGCIFCRIVAGQEPADVMYRDEKFLVIKDHRPAAEHHYLVLPVMHMEDAKHLTLADIPLVERMETLGKKVLQQRGAPIDDVRLGFHWPPFQAVKHLHMHCVGPVSEMGYFNKKVSFRPDSWCFVTIDWILARLQNGSP